MSIAARLRKLEGTGPRFDPEDCPGPTTCLLHDGEGQLVPALPEDAARCPLCGSMHVRHIKFVVVTTREEADTMIDELVRASGVKRQ